jgi:predicted house-cleaning noncanonical NTP pyrophosphatase (MazG superfamily)
MEDIKKLREKRNRKVENIKKRTIADIREVKDKTIRKLNLSKNDFIKKRAKQQKGEGRFLGD